MTKIYLDENGLVILESEFDATKGHEIIEVDSVEVDLNHLSESTKVIDEFEKNMRQLTSAYSKEEQKTWQTQIEEAKAYKADSSIEVPMLTEISDGSSIDALANRIIAKATYLTIESGKFLAIKNRKLKALEDAAN